MYEHNQCNNESSMSSQIRLHVNGPMHTMQHSHYPFANSLDPDQAQQNVGPDLDPNSLTP